MKLVDVYTTGEAFGSQKIPSFGAAKILWELLGERMPEQSISHKGMPTWDEHCRFVRSRPYLCWYLIALDIHPEVEMDDMTVNLGAIYLTKQREIGVFIFKAHQGKGYGYRAVKMLMELHSGRFVWNVNPLNHRSIAMVKALGGRLIQHTFEIAP